MRITRILAAGTLALTLTACAETGYDGRRYGYYDDRPAVSGQTVGMVGGAVLGGLAGSQFGGGSGKIATTGIGAVLGGLAGSAIGSSYDRREIERRDVDRRRRPPQEGVDYPWIH